MTDRGLAVSIIKQEGSHIYSDDQGRENVQLVSCLVLAQFIGRQGEDPVMTCWRPFGNITNIAESLATLFTKEPGLKDAVDGLYMMIQKRLPK